jgi:PAT family beta-lactamase induction signal transducer AmpG
MIQNHLAHSWLGSIQAFLRPQVITMLFLGFSAGIPLLLIFSSLSLWLIEAGIKKSTVTFFSWAALGYSFKFLWAPLIDRLPVPFLTAWLGRRRAWLLIAQFLIITAIVLMAMIDPAKGEHFVISMAFAAILLGFSSATQDIVIDAYRIESAEASLQALLSSSYIVGYRLGMLASGAGALVLASYFGSESGAYSYQAWQMTYISMSALMLVGVITTLLVSEPDNIAKIQHHYTTRQYLRFLALFVVCIILFVASYLFFESYVATAKLWLSAYIGKPLAGLLTETIRLFCAGAVVSGFVVMLSKLTSLVEKELVIESYIDPVKDFFHRYGKNIALVLLVFICFYRISDIVLGVISNVFFHDIGFNKIQIATVVKTFGVFMTIAGGILGGVLAVRFGVMKILFLGALLTVLTNLLFMLLASAGNDLLLLYVVISADNLSAGIASAAFVAFLSSLTNISFTAVQYAIFSSLMLLIPKTIGGYSGSMVESIGYSNFFLVASLMGVPVLLLIYFLNKHLSLKE